MFYHQEFRPVFQYLDVRGVFRVENDEVGLEVDEDLEVQVHETADPFDFFRLFRVVAKRCVADDEVAFPQFEYDLGDSGGHGDDPLR